MAEVIAGGIISLDPLITYSRGGAGIAPYGLPGAYPELFRNRRALHFFGSPWSIEGRESAYVGGMKSLQAALGSNNLLVFLAADDFEASLVSARGVPCFVGTHLMFTDENTFRPMPPPDGARLFDAVYNARPVRFKRHELAVDIDSLMLIYFEFGVDREEFPRFKRLLPNAFFANKELSGHDWQWLGPGKVAELLSRCRVGLCLSAKEGAMRAAMEYLLCGLCVVSTRSIGGRGRYLMPPYATIVDEDDPKAVSRAVSEMLERNIPKAAVRDQIGRILTFERHAFLETVTRIAQRHFDRDDFSLSIDPFVKHGNVFRPMAETVAPVVALEASVGAPAIVSPELVQAKTLAFVLGPGRSGSHLLRSFLSQHNSVSAVSEVFNQDLARRLPFNFNDFLSAYFKEHPDWRMRHDQAESILEAYFEWLAREAQGSTVVVDVKDDQLRILDWPSASYTAPSQLLRFIRKPIHPVIRLIREDKLSQYASVVLAQRTGRWSRATSDTAVANTPSIKLQPDAVLEALADIQAAEAAIEKCFAGRARVARVTYETMLDGDKLSASVRCDIEEALGLKLPPDAIAGTAKLAPPLRNLVENLDEILERLDGTPFSWLRLLHGAR